VIDGASPRGSRDWSCQTASARHKSVKQALVVGTGHATVCYSLALNYIDWTSESVIARITEFHKRASADISLEPSHRRVKLGALKPRGWVLTSTESGASGFAIVRGRTSARSTRNVWQGLKHCWPIDDRQPRHDVLSRFYGDIVGACPAS
jgi:hypothetical protein